MLLTNNLGYPRVGAFRELKKANEAYWAKKISAEELLQAGLKIRESNWKTQKDAGIELIPSNDFSFYDQVLDLSLTVGANRIIPTVAIPHPLGNPNLTKEDEYTLRRKLVEKALKALETEVDGQKIFE